MKQPLTNHWAEIYRDEAHEWRWRRVALNGRITATSGEGYTRKADAVEAAKRELPDDWLIIRHEADED